MRILHQNLIELNFQRKNYLRRAVDGQSWARDIVYTTAISEISCSVLIANIHGAIQAQEGKNIDRIYYSISDSPTSSFPSNLDPSAPIFTLFSSCKPMYGRPNMYQKITKANYNKNFN